MNYLRYFSIVITVFIASFLIRYNNQKSVQVASNNVARVAMLVPAVHPAMEEIMNGLKSELTKTSPLGYECIEFNANGNKTLMRSQAEEIVNGNFDVAFSIGAGATQMMHELIKKRQSGLPLVFTAVENPLQKGLISSVERPGGIATGVQELVLYENQVARLMELAPHIKTVLLVYDPVHPGIIHEKEAFVAGFAKYNVVLRSAEVFNSAEISQKVGGLLDGVDALLVLKDHTVVTGIDALISLANKHHIILYASDLNSADKGAALAFGVTEASYGSAAAPLIINIVQKKQKVSDIAVVSADKQYIKINKQAAEKQGLIISDEQYKTLEKNGDFII